MKKKKNYKLGNKYKSWVLHAACKQLQPPTKPKKRQQRQNNQKKQEDLRNELN
jgi:hypothetical protein